jgi:hypothetical protein
VNNPFGCSFATDPAYMANHSPCNAWLYTDANADASVDPGLTPLVSTFYDGESLYNFFDVGSIATEDAQIISMVYYGSSRFGLDPGTGFNESWGLFIDDVGNRISITNDPQYQFYPGDTGISVPDGVNGPPGARRVYDWKFGAQFLWVPVTPQTATKSAHHTKLYLYVTYQGYPTGSPGLPIQNMLGLFVVTPNTGVDLYNRNLSLKIPNPTIRTAYIGE